MNSTVETPYSNQLGSKLIKLKESPEFQKYEPNAREQNGSGKKRPKSPQERVNAFTQKILNFKTSRFNNERQQNNSNKKK